MFACLEGIPCTIVYLCGAWQVDDAWGCESCLAFSLRLLGVLDEDGLWCCSSARARLWRSARTQSPSKFRPATVETVGQFFCVRSLMLMFYVSNGLSSSKTSNEQYIAALNLDDSDFRAGIR